MASTQRKHKSVSRIDQPSKHTHGWYVRVRFQSEEISKFFPDKTQGGKKKALEAAIEFRDRTEKKMGKPRTDRTVVGSRLGGKRKMTGVRRVVKTTRTVDGQIRKNPVYEVTWSPSPNVLRRTSFSIRKWGSEEAFRLACKLRADKEKEYYGVSRGQKG